MDAHLFRRLCEDLVPALIGARIEKIYQVAEDIITFSVYGLGKIQKREGQEGYAFEDKKYYLTYKGGKDSVLFLGTTKVASGEEPPAFVMRLRKYLSGKHIKRVFANWIERKIYFEVNGAWFLIDLRNGIELLFDCPLDVFPPCREVQKDENAYLAYAVSYSISPSLFDKDFSQYFPELAIVLTEKNPEIWRSYPVLTPLLRKTLPLLENEEQIALYADLQFGGGDVFVYTINQRNLKLNQSVENTPLNFAQQTDKFLVSPWKMPQTLLKTMGFQTQVHELAFENAIDAFAYIGDMLLAKIQKETKALSIKQLQASIKRLTKLELKLADEEERLTRLVNMKEQALILQANLYQFKQEEKAEKVFVYDMHGQEVTINLDKSKTIRENMENFFHAAGRGERGLTHLIIRKQQVEQEKQALLDEMWQENAGAGIKLTNQKKKEKIQEDYGLLGKITNNKRFATKDEKVVAKKNKDSKKKFPKEVQVFRSSDGFMILRGRDTKGNGLALKMASPYDIWVHIAEGASAHVIIKRDHAKQEVSPVTMQEAGALALLKSWVKGQEKGTVQFSYAKNIRPMKNASAGLVHVDKSEGTYSVIIDPSIEDKLRLAE